jgi:glycosyltransferase involved in cell wall biosynthesis
MDPQRVVTVPNGVDDRAHRPVDRAAARAALGLTDEFLWLSLGRYCVQKNTYGLLCAFLDLAERRPDAHLLLSGRPDDPVFTEQLLVLRDRSAARDRVHLRDHCPAPAVLLAAADGFVLDSFFEGWSLASLEALYAGLPVVVSDVGGAREQIGEPGLRGHLVDNPAGSPEDVTWERMSALRYAAQPNATQLVASMDAVMDARARWAEAREALWSDSEVRFAPGRCVVEHAAVLRDVTQGRGAASSVAAAEMRS